MRRHVKRSIILLTFFHVLPALAQSSTNLPVLQGLVPISALDSSTLGKAALIANFQTTWTIQNGSAKQRVSLAFPEQQQQALRDAYITDGNAYELADGLGANLRRAYQTLAPFENFSAGKAPSAPNISPAVGLLIAYTNEITRSDSNSAKYFFANRTTDGKTSVSAEAAEIMTKVGGVPDIFGRTIIPPAAPKPIFTATPVRSRPNLTSL
jgi:hypothetical protein